MGAWTSPGDSDDVLHEEADNRLRLADVLRLVHDRLHHVDVVLLVHEEVLIFFSFTPVFPLSSLQLPIPWLAPGANQDWPFANNT